MTSNVPKFASFRPKPKPAPEPPKQPQQEPRPDKYPKDRARVEKRLSPSLAKKQKLDHNEASTKAYFSDRRGDPDIARYGTLNRYHVPSYRRSGYGHVLGLDSSQKIDRENSSDKSILIIAATRLRQERLLASKHVRRDEVANFRFIGAIQPNPEPGADFIRFSKGFRKRQGDSDDETEQDLDYRGLERKRDSSTLPHDSDLESESDHDLPILGAEAVKRNTELVRRTRESPDDVESWLNLVHHQEAIVRYDRSFEEELNESARRQLAEARITIFEEALKRIGSDRSSQIKLYLGLLSESQYILDEIKLATKWKDVISKFPQDTGLWLRFLDFSQSGFRSFKYEMCCASFKQCFTDIGACSQAPSAESVLHLLIRMTAMMQEAGYQELALAIWQALMEFNLHRPDFPDESPQDVLSKFEEFWESEVPRIGEPESKGWKNFDPNQVPPPCPPSLLPVDSSTGLMQFLALEMDASMKLRIPGRTTDNVGEDDAFHTIFFSDIEEYLSILPKHTPALLIVEAFLCFCGLPRLTSLGPHQRAWWSDPFLQKRSKEVPRPDSQGNLLSQAFEGFMECPLQSLEMSHDFLFRQSFSCLKVRLDMGVIKRILKTVAFDPNSDVVLGEYLIAFEFYSSPDTVFKIAKQLLKNRPSLRFYNAYGNAEVHRGNVDKADQVFSAALSIESAKASLMTLERLQLFESWVLTALRHKSHVDALWRLASFPNPLEQRVESKETPSETVLNQSRSDLGEVCEQALLRQDYQSAIVTTSLLAIFAYTSNDSDVEAALAAFKNLSMWFKSHKLSDSQYAELHAQKEAHFLLHHASHAAIVKPSLIRSTLEPLISQFPQNTILLSLYAANETRFSIDDRVRSTMHQNALQPSEATSVAGWSFAIHYEKKRGKIAGTTSHSIRALYKRATKPDASGAHSPALWMSYLRFELDELEKARAKGVDKRPRKDDRKRTWENRVDDAELRVKEIFFAGLRALPWCKDFIMLAFSDSRDIFTEDELWKIYRAMQEKELRLYVELDEPMP